MSKIKPTTDALKGAGVKGKHAEVLSDATLIQIAESQNPKLETTADDVSTASTYLEK